MVNEYSSTDYDIIKVYISPFTSTKSNLVIIITEEHALTIFYNASLSPLSLDGNGSEFHSMGAMERMFLSPYLTC